MQSSMSAKAIGTLLLLLSPWSTSSSVGQQYPTRPIIVIVPLPAGGGTDVVARIVTERMAKTLGQPLVVENIPAVAGTIGVSRLAQAAPDGQTIAIGDQTSFVVSSAVYKVSYDVLGDFEPISLLSTSPVLLVGSRTVPAADLSELIAWLRANPEKATMATFGRGSGPHISGLAFQNLTGTRLRAVPYRGLVLALPDVMAGQVDLMLSELSNVISHVRKGTIRPYAVLADVRAAAAPEIPTIDQAGGPPLHVTTWRGIWAPKGTPAHVIAKIHAAVVEALGDADVRNRIAETGQEIVPRERQNPQALAAHHRAEMAKWAPMIKAAAIEPQ
jgi:tripartite-type tricarboxylate transporter receptor subunit TctC